ncbi:MAG: hypothetical protein R8G34_00430 [Paracoccaceae bacterium]|nr:hypothetical protein [Paracoccaceae bacterium]
MGVPIMAARGDGAHADQAVLGFSHCLQIAAEDARNAELRFRAPRPGFSARHLFCPFHPHACRLSYYPQTFQFGQGARHPRFLLL